MLNWNTNRNMGRALMGLVLVLFLLLGNDPALAWGRKKKKKDTKKEPPKAVNLEKFPSMDIYRGVLHKDAFGEWSLDQRPLSFNRNSRVSGQDEASGAGSLREGRIAMVTAANIGGTLIVRRVTMLNSHEMLERGAYSVGSSTEELEAGSRGIPQ